MPSVVHIIKEAKFSQDQKIMDQIKYADKAAFKNVRDLITMDQDYVLFRQHMGYWREDKIWEALEEGWFIICIQRKTTKLHSYFNFKIKLYDLLSQRRFEKRYKWAHKYLQVGWVCYRNNEDADACCYDPIPFCPRNINVTEFVTTTIV